jgi:hypothetical protein
MEIYVKITIKKNSEGNKYVETNKSGYDLVQDPLLNKGSLFSADEINDLTLRGIVTPHDFSLQDLVEKTFHTLNEKSTHLEKHIYLRALQDRNETLFYALTCKYPVELMPLIYTPYVGEACEKFSEIYRHPRGVFIRYEDRLHLDEILSHPRFNDTRMIVVSD